MTRTYHLGLKYKVKQNYNENSPEHLMRLVKQIFDTNEDVELTSWSVRR